MQGTVRSIEMPDIGIGTFRLQGKECSETVFQALKVGYRLIDTAAVYKNEREVGDAIRRFLECSQISRKDIFVTSKLGMLYVKDSNGLCFWM